VIVRIAVAVTVGRWSMLWRVPVALVLAVFYLACCAVQDAQILVRRLRRHWR
jgi:hypothetical protein